ncbi:hypothetical protein QBC39DRAFT_26350 [Podospora conica]|nr:hypothetical protein QBC39DRAFT_26350 [Schizothecium conicum]
MDPLSVIASVTGLLALTIKTAAALESYKMLVKNAPAEIQALVEELGLLTGILSEVETHFRNHPDALNYGNTDEKNAANLPTIVKTIAGCQTHLLKAIAALEEYGIIAPEDAASSASAPGTKNKVKSMFKRMKYPFDREYIQSLLTVVRDYKATLTLALSLEGKKSVDVLHTTLARLEAVSIRSDDALASIRDQNNQLLAALIGAMDGIRPPAYTPMAPAGESTVQHFEVPQQPTATFVGRLDVLQQVEEHFDKDPAAPEQRRCALYGLGGSGKTQIVLKFAFSQRHAYDHVFFVNAASNDSATLGYAKIHGLLGLGQASSDEDKVEMVRRWFSKSGNTNWLLILDNADDLDEIDLWSYIPVVDAGNVLITSRDGRIDDPELATLAIPLDMLPEDDALALLKRRSGIKAVLDDVQTTAAKSIVEELGFLPLAIDQAAAYVQARKKTFKDYLALYYKQQKALLNFKSKLSKHQKTVLTTWEISFQKLEQDSPEVAELLLLLCQYDNAYIADSMLERGTTPQLSYGRDGEEVQFPPEKSGIPQSLIDMLSDPMGLDDAVEKLRSFSLAQRFSTGNGFVLHPLVQFCGQQRADDEALRSSFSTALRLLSHSFPRGSLDDWNVNFSLEFLPQVEHFCQQLEKAIARGDDMVSLAFTSISLLTAAYHFASPQWCERFVKVAETLLPSLSPLGGNTCVMEDYDFLVAFVSERRGKISPSLGHPEKGIEKLSNFVKNRPNISGDPSSPDPTLRAPNHLANSMHGCVYVLLAQQLLDAGRPADALPYLLEWQPFSPPSVSERGVMRYRDRTLANYYLTDPTRWADAESVLRSILSLDMADAATYVGTLGEGWTLQQLAEILLETNRPSEAATLLMPAIAAREAAGNLEREDTTLLMLDLVAALLEQGSLDIALVQMTKLRQVVTRRATSGGSGSAAASETTLDALAQMWCLVARLSCALGNWVEARACWEKAVETIRTRPAKKGEGFLLAAAEVSLVYTRWSQEGHKEVGEAVKEVELFGLQGRKLTDVGIGRSWVEVLKRFQAGEVPAGQTG